MSSKYKTDCRYYDNENQRVRPYCEKLDREIRVRDCEGCGWYDFPSLGIGAMVENDLFRVAGEIKENEARKKIR